MDQQQPKRSAYRLETSKSGYFEIRWCERQPDGKWRSRSASTRQTDIHRAERVLAGFIEVGGREAREENGFADLSIDELTEFYIENRIRRRGTWLGGPTGVRSRMLSFRDCKVSQITINFVDAWIEETSPYYKPETQRGYLATLKTIIRFAIKKQKIDPRHMPIFELPTQGEPKALWLNEDQEAHFLKVAEKIGGPIWLFIAIAANTGARREAIFELDWKRINLQDRQIDFRKPGRKTGNKRRVVAPILSRLLPVLTAHRKEEGRVIDLATVNTINTKFEKVSKAAGMPWVTPHVLRHTFCTLMLRKGIDIWVVASLVGDTVTTVDRTYAHRSSDNLLAKVDL